MTRFDGRKENVFVLDEKVGIKLSSGVGTEVKDGGWDLATLAWRCPSPPCDATKLRYHEIEHKAMKQYLTNIIGLRLGEMAHFFQYFSVSMHRCVIGRRGTMGCGDHVKYLPKGFK